MNKSGEKVNKEQLSEAERCLTDFQRGTLAGPSVFEACMAADRRNRVKKAMVRTETQDFRMCVPPAVPLPFGYTGAATVNEAAVDGALALTRKIFGGPTVNDGDLVKTADDNQTATCQREMLVRAGRLESTVLRTLNRAKRLAIRDPAVGSSAALEERLEAVFSSNDPRISRMQDGLVTGVERKCAALPGSFDTIFPGSCANPNLGDVSGCVVAAARCQACLKINAFDDLNMDCDQADDGNTNGSCPLAPFDNVVFDQTTNADCFPAIAPDSASNIAKICVDLARSAPDMPFRPADYEAMPDECRSIVLPECRAVQAEGLRSRAGRLQVDRIPGLPFERSTHTAEIRGGLSP